MPEVAFGLNIEIDKHVGLDTSLLFPKGWLPDGRCHSAFLCWIDNILTH